jgi:thioredoxin 1
MQTRNSATVTLTAENFEHEIEQLRGLAIVDFYADWCGPCFLLSPILEQLAQDYAGRVKVGRVDVDAQPALMARFQIRSLPSVLYFKDGAHVDTIVGAHPRPMLAQKLEQHLE